MWRSRRCQAHYRRRCHHPHQQLRRSLRGTPASRALSVSLGTAAPAPVHAVTRTAACVASATARAAATRARFAISSIAAAVERVIPRSASTVCDSMSSCGAHGGTRELVPIAAVATAAAETARARGAAPARPDPWEPPPRPPSAAAARPTRPSRRRCPHLARSQGRVTTARHCLQCPQWGPRRARRHAAQPWRESMSARAAAPRALAATGTAASVPRTQRREAHGRAASCAHAGRRSGGGERTRGWHALVFDDIAHALLHPPRNRESGSARWECDHLVGPRTPAHTHTYTHKHTHTHTHTHTYTYTHTHIHKNTHIHTCTHTHTEPHSRDSSQAGTR